MKNLSANLWLGGPVILSVGLVLLFVSHSRQDFAIWYAANIFPVFTYTIGLFFGLFPISVAELFLIIAVLFAVWKIFLFIFYFRRFKFRRKHLLVISYVLPGLFLMFVLTAGINYNRESYAYHIGITVQPTHTDALIEMYLMLVERAHSLAPLIETDAYGRFMLSTYDIHSYANLSMRNLHNTYGGLNAHFPRAKAPFLSVGLSHLNIGGIFFPWTMEAHYNGDMPATNIPFTINHELAHVAGHMREDEANFIAYLASRDSGHIDFEYSAVYMALSYTLNAMRRVMSADLYSEYFDLLPEQLKHDFAAARAYWQRFQGRPAEIQRRANDAYLRLNQQFDGVMSYGRMVDLMLAYYHRPN